MMKRVVVLSLCLVALAVNGCGGGSSDFLVGYQLGRAAGPPDNGEFARCRATGATVEQCCENHPSNAACE